MDNIRVDCECHTEILEVDYFKEENQFCLLVYRYAPLRVSFWRRLRFLFRGTVEYNEIVLSPENANKVANFININNIVNGK